MNIETLETFLKSGNIEAGFAIDLVYGIKGEVKSVKRVNQELEVVTTNYTFTFTNENLEKTEKIQYWENKGIYIYTPYDHIYFRKVGGQKYE